MSDFDLDILLRQSRKFGRDGQHLVGLAQFDLGPAETAFHHRRKVGSGDAAKHVIEQTVHFAMKRQERIEVVANRRKLLAP
ncbi:hypothetical protein ACTGJ9_014230 [Bradyrhizobium sp. RDM12]